MSKDPYKISSPSSATPPAGNDTEVQWNNNGVFGANSNFTFDDSNQTLQLTGNQTIVGNADERQLIVRANSTETGNIFEVQSSDGTARSGALSTGGLLSSPIVTGKQLAVFRQRYKQ